MRRLLLLAALLSAGCQSDGPKFSIGDTLVFEGTLLTDQANSRHDFTLTDSGTVRFGLPFVAARDSETDEPIDDPRVGVSIGRPQSDGRCSVSFRTGLTQGGAFSLYLDDRAYCLVVFRSTGLPTTSVVDYNVTLEPAFG